VVSVRSQPNLDGAARADALPAAEPIRMLLAPPLLARLRRLVAEMERDLGDEHEMCVAAAASHEARPDHSENDSSGGNLPAELHSMRNRRQNQLHELRQLLFPPAGASTPAAAAAADATVSAETVPHGGGEGVGRGIGRSAAISDFCTSDNLSEETQLDDRGSISSPPRSREAFEERHAAAEAELQAAERQIRQQDMECQAFEQELAHAKAEVAESRSEVAAESLGHSLRGELLRRPGSAALASAAVWDEDEALTAERANDRAIILELKAEVAQWRGEARSLEAANAAFGARSPKSATACSHAAAGEVLRDGRGSPLSERQHPSSLDGQSLEAEDAESTQVLRQELAAARAAQSWKDRQRGHECMMIAELQQLLEDAQARADRHAVLNRSLRTEVCQLEQQGFEESAARAANMGHDLANRVRVAELERLLAESQRAVAAFARQQGMLRAQLLARDTSECHDQWHADGQQQASALRRQRPVQQGAYHQTRIADDGSTSRYGASTALGDGSAGSREEASLPDHWHAPPPSGGGAPADPRSVSESERRQHANALRMRIMDLEAQLAESLAVSQSILQRRTADQQVQFSEARDHSSASAPAGGSSSCAARSSGSRGRGAES